MGGWVCVLVSGQVGQFSRWVGACVRACLFVGKVGSLVGGWAGGLVGAGVGSLSQLIPNRTQAHPALPLRGSANRRVVPSGATHPRLCYAAPSLPPSNQQEWHTRTTHAHRARTHPLSNGRNPPAPGPRLKVDASMNHHPMGFGCSAWASEAKAREGSKGISTRRNEAQAADSQAAGAQKERRAKARSPPAPPGENQQHEQHEQQQQQQQRKQQREQQQQQHDHTTPRVRLRLTAAAPCNVAVRQEASRPRFARFKKTKTRSKHANAKALAM